MLTINGRPIAFHEYRRRRHRRPERALFPLTLIIAAGVWLPDVGSPLEHARIVGDGTDAYCRSLPAPIADVTQEPPFALEMRPRRRRWISVVGNLIFAALCMIIAMFFIFVLGIFGALLYLTS